MPTLHSVDRTDMEGAEKALMTDLTIADFTLDCTGKACPVPILKLSKAITQLQPGHVVEPVATDSGSRDDVLAFCKRTDNALLSSWEEEGASCSMTCASPGSAMSVTWEWQ